MAAANFLGFRRHVIEPAADAPRILAFLNISFGGIFGFSSRLMVGERAEIQLCDAREAVACARDNADLVLGMKVRTGRIAGGASGIGPLEVALEAADELGLPLMTHIDDPPPGRRTVLGMLRPGDILTHCFRPFPNAPVQNGRIREDVRAARARGLIFDIGHGMGSFDFAVARTMLAEGFEPDVISIDLHLFCVEGPVYDLPTCLSKLVALGLSLPAAIRAATLAPAEAIGRSELGRLAPGLPGDATVLRLESGQFAFRDVRGNIVKSQERLVSAGIVMGGRWMPNDAPGPDLAAPVPALPATHAEAVRRHFGAGGACCEPADGAGGLQAG